MTEVEKMSQSQEKDDFELAKALQEQEDREFQKINSEKRIKAFEQQERYRLKNQNSSVTVDYTRGQLGFFQEMVKKNQQKQYDNPDLDDYWDDYYDDGDFSVNQQTVKKKHPKADFSPVEPPSSFDEEFSDGKYSNEENRGEDEEFDFDTEINVKSTITHSVTGKLSRDKSKLRQREVKNKDISDRATVEHVMDQRTRMIIFRMINRQILGSINGCVSTGKEANVYYAKSVSGKEHFAVKVYKTSILQFKDRERYIEGEFRFQRYSKHNPRKMVRMWAEKEMRNLKRLEAVGIVVPKVHSLQQHVLVMEFIGRKGWPAKLLKDTKFSTKKYRRIYKSVVIIMRNMFRKAKLIHADFSEYNILFYKGKVIVIDVSQSVEFDHPNAMVFLKSDCTNIREYFKKRGVVEVLDLRQMFEFITNDSLEKSKLNEILESLMIGNMKKMETNMNQTDFAEKVNDDVFKGSFMPQKMEDIQEDNFEDNFEAFKERFVKKKSDNFDDSELLGGDNEEEGEESEGGEEEGEGGGEEEEGESKIKDIGHFLKGLDRKERKKLVKQMKSEKRMKKVPKKVKKRRQKVSRRGNKRLNK